MGTSAHRKGMQRYLVCKGPPLHQVPMIILISLRQGKLASLESLCEACAVRVCKGPPLHQVPMIILVSLRLGKLASLESLYEACADGDICTPLLLHTLTSTHKNIYTRGIYTYKKDPAEKAGPSFIWLSKTVYLMITIFLVLFRLGVFNL
jgi:hypothetical protein